MSERKKAATSAGGLVRFLWQRRLWWLLPLGVLLVLIGIVYVLGHMSSADTEMYPTTSQNNSVRCDLC